MSVPIMYLESRMFPLDVKAAVNFGQHPLSFATLRICRLFSSTLVVVHFCKLRWTSVKSWLHNPPKMEEFGIECREIRVGAERLSIACMSCVRSMLCLVFFISGSSGYLSHLVCDYTRIHEAIEPWYVWSASEAVAIRSVSVGANVLIEVGHRSSNESWSGQVGNRQSVSWKVGELVVP